MLKAARRPSKHGIFSIPDLGPDRIVRSQSAVPASFVPKGGGVGGARSLERCDGRHGSEGGPCATCRPGPLIAAGLAAFAPSSWDLDTAANRAPGAPFVRVANVSRQSGSVEALWKLCQTRRNATASRRSGGLFGESSVSGTRQQQLNGSGSPPSTWVNRPRHRESICTPSTPDTSIRLIRPSRVWFRAFSTDHGRCRVPGTVRQSDHCMSRGLITWDFQNLQAGSNPNRKSNLGGSSASQHGQALEPKSFSVVLRRAWS